MTTATRSAAEGSASSTLYFGPWYRRSPFFEKTLEAGCSAYDIYNHMYLPGYYADPVEEYWALLEGVTLETASGRHFDLDRGPGGLQAYYRNAKGQERRWVVLGASRGEPGILGEGIRQALLRDPTYAPALQAAWAAVS